MKTDKIYEILAGAHDVERSMAMSCKGPELTTELARPTFL